MLEDEDAYKIRIANRAQYIPRQRDDAERGDRQRVRDAKSHSPLLCRQRPKANGAARENNRRRALCEHGKSEKNSEQGYRQKISYWGPADTYRLPRTLPRARTRVRRSPLPT